MDAELSKLHGIVEHARENRKVGEDYMTMQDYVDCELKRRLKEEVEKGVAEAVETAVAEAVEAAVAEAKAEAITEVVEMLKELNIPDEQIEEKIMEKYQLSREEVKAYLN